MLKFRACKSERFENIREHYNQLKPQVGNMDLAQLSTSARCKCACRLFLKTIWLWLSDSSYRKASPAIRESCRIHWWYFYALQERGELSIFIPKKKVTVVSSNEVVSATKK